MQQTILILFIFGDDIVKKEITELLKKNNPIRVINSEYIESEYDKALGLEPYKDIKDEDRKASRRNSSVLRMLSTNSAGNHFIIDIDNIPPDLIAAYASAAKTIGNKLKSITITEIPGGGTKGHEIFFQGECFEIFSELYKNSRFDTKIISNPHPNEDPKKHYRDLTSALHLKSELIICQDNELTDEDRTHFLAFGAAHNLRTIKMVTGDVDLKNPTVLIKGKPLTTKKQDDSTSGSRPTSSSSHTDVKLMQKIKDLGHTLLSLLPRKEKHVAKVLSQEEQQRHDFIKNLQAKTAQQLNENAERPTKQNESVNT